MSCVPTPAHANRQLLLKTRQPCAQLGNPMRCLLGGVFTFGTSEISYSHANRQLLLMTRQPRSELGNPVSCLLGGVFTFGTSEISYSHANRKLLATL